MGNTDGQARPRACLRQQRGVPTGHATTKRIYQMGVLVPAVLMLIPRQWTGHSDDVHSMRGQ